MLTVVLQKFPEPLVSQWAEMVRSGLEGVGGFAAWLAGGACAAVRCWCRPRIPFS